MSYEKLPSAERLMEQAGSTAVTWMRTAVVEIDELFGKGYAKAHPELIVGFMQAAGADEIAMYLRGLVNAHQQVEETLEVLSDRLSRESVSEDHPSRQIPHESVGQRVKRLREHLQISQVELAARCGWESQSRIGNYETGVRKVNAEDAEIIARVLGVTPGELLFAK